jgi:single-strand DNA-binding protein
MLNTTIVGHITSDVTLKFNADNQAFTTLRIASDRRYRDKDDIRQTDFISVKVWGHLAETCAKYCCKGCRVAVNGDLETYEDQDTHTTRFFVKARAVEFLFPMVPQVEREMESQEECH